jgi:L-2,4-diaminobutyrate decarboxylase
MEDKLKEVYNPENFKQVGYELIDLISGYLKDAEQGNIPVNKFEEPETQMEFRKNYDLGDNPPVKLFKDIIDRSIHVHHPKYMGHQISPAAPVSALASMLSAILNNGMAIYEMGSAATAIEKVVVDMIAQKIGWGQEGDGFLTSGGTIGNLTALLAARQTNTSEDIWENGLEDNLGIMVSSEAHYSVDRALRIMGFGTKGIIKIPVGETFTMKTQLLDEYYEKATLNGIKVIAVVGSAPSTSTGMYDDLESIAKFCAKQKIWFHVDGAHGGAAIFSSKYKHLLKGIEHADSIVIDGHKMLMTPSIMTFLLFKEKIIPIQLLAKKLNTY